MEDDTAVTRAVAREKLAAQDVLPFPAKPSGSTAGRTLHESTYAPLPAPRRRAEATVAEVLRNYGYATGAWAKGHNTPADETTVTGPFDNWPAGVGFGPVPPPGRAALLVVRVRSSLVTAGTESDCALAVRLGS